MRSLIRYIVAAGLLIMALSNSSFAQVAEKKTLALEGAKKVAAAAEAEARKNNEGAVIAVVDDGGNLMFLERIDGTFPAGAKVSIGKARTAALFKKPTTSPGATTTAVPST